jgi:hypothetical protein
MMSRHRKGARLASARPRPDHKDGAFVAVRFAAFECRGSSGFANIDLDMQLKKHGIHKLIVIGLRTTTCVEATVRFAVERCRAICEVCEQIGGELLNATRPSVPCRARRAPPKSSCSGAGID